MAELLRYTDQNLVLMALLLAASVFVVLFLFLYIRERRKAEKYRDAADIDNGFIKMFEGNCRCEF